MEDQGLKVVAVHDRPQKTALGNYTYLVECSGGGYSAFEAVQKANAAVAVRYLGSFLVR